MNKIISIFFSFLILAAANSAYADKSILWTSSLNKKSTFKNYVLINESEKGISEKLTSLVGSRAGKDMLNSSFRITSNSGGVVTVESTLNSPDLKGNRISTTFSAKTFSIKRSVISSPEHNIVELMPAVDSKGDHIRGLTESATTVKTSLLDGTAPLVDIISIIYLMQGNNGGHAKKLHNKPLYFYLNGLLRKTRLQLAGSGKINWFGKQRNATRFNLMREADNMGSIWIEANSTGEPLKIKIGVLNFSIKSN